MTNLLTPIAPLIASVITPVITIARQAGEKILQVYQQDFTVTDKADHTPLTQADLQAHEHIVASLRILTPDLPVISEESSPDEIAQRMSWTRYWLVDPLDGTKEFIKKNGEFTVNIALIDNGVAVFGVVYAPVPNTTWWGAQQQGVLKQPGAFKIQGDQPAQAIHVSAPPANGQPWRIVAVGSSIKLCLVAEGRADLYPKLGPTGEWDTAAGQAVVEAAGGQVVAWPSLQTLRYNQRPDTLINPDFMVCAQPDEYWAGPR